MLKSKPGSVSSNPKAYTRPDASPHRVGSLSIGPSLDELHHGNECRPPWHLEGASILGKQMGKGLIGKARKARKVS